MGALFLSTLEMMCLTFAIGFVVAAVIRLIAYFAESFEFYNNHRDELVRLHRMKDLASRSFFYKIFSPPMSAEKKSPDYELNSYYRGVNDEVVNPQDIEKFYHETSLGGSDFSLMDYYYPSDAKIKIVEHNSKIEESLTKPKKSKKK